MSLTIKSGFAAAALRVAAARAEYQGLMHAELTVIVAEAEHLAKEGVHAGVYDTAPGEYERTHKLLDGTYAKALTLGTAIGVQVGNTAPWASLVEYGTFGHYESPVALLIRAEAQPGIGVLNLGRTAENWKVPNPAITRAAAVAGVELAAVSTATLRRVMRRG